jgi:hypothetical protein
MNSSGIFVSRERKQPRIAVIMDSPAPPFRRMKARFDQSPKLDALRAGSGNVILLVSQQMSSHEISFNTEPLGLGLTSSTKLPRHSFPLPILAWVNAW